MRYVAKASSVSGARTCKGAGKEGVNASASRCNSETMNLITFIFSAYSRHDLITRQHWIHTCISEDHDDEHDRTAICIDMHWGLSHQLKQE